MPTNSQAQTCICVCQILSNFYKSIELFRFDEVSKTIFIFAGEELQIVINPDGKWGYLDES